MTPRRIVIVGGGFAGLRLARLLDRRGWRRPVEVTLIDRTPYHILRPKLPQAVGGRIACAVHLPLAALVSGTRVRVLTREITAIDPAGQRVTWNGGAMDADVLVLALGAGPRVPPGLADDPAAVLPIWDFDQACGLRRRVQFLAEAAREGRAVNSDVAVIGGGFVGVEIAAEVQARLGRLYGRRATPTVTLLERQSRVLPRLSGWAGAAAMRRLARLGVNVLAGVSAVHVADGRVHLSDGRILSVGTVIWAGGNIQSPPMVAASGLTDETGRVPVRWTLETERYPGVFALGDCAYIPGAGSEASEPSAHRAEAQAVTAARNISAQLEDGQAIDNRSAGNIYMLGLGPGYGILEAGPLRAAGWGPSLLKELVRARHLLQAGGWKVLRAAAPRVILDAVRTAAWDTAPLADGAVDVGPVPGQSAS